MKKATKETFYLMIGSFFAVFISLAVETLLSDFGNGWSWFMFIIVIILLGILARWLLNIFYKVTAPRRKKNKKS
ncbi:MAG: hypothetical protein WC781_05255 [Candidatus Pacearchaeota archaeon]|jgi:hypothetical protein